MHPEQNNEPIGTGFKVLFFRALKKARHIGTGWFHFLVWASLETKSRSRERLKECQACDNAVPDTTLKIIHGMFKEVSEKKCVKPIGCGCPIVEKSLVKEETCPLNKWK